MALREDIKKAWVADLRDPRNKQANGVLRNAHDEFCCYGRLCEVVKNDFEFDIEVGRTLDEEENYYDESDYLYIYKNQEDYELPPNDLMIALGFDFDKDGWVTVEVSEEIQNEYNVEKVVRLDVLNDKGMPFAEIADLIEKSDL
jgi:hypothetical protein